MAVKFIIHTMATIKNVPPNILTQIKKDLTIENPAFTNQKRMVKKGVLTRCVVEQFLKLYFERGSSSVVVPRGYMNRAIYLLGTNEYEIIDHSVCPLLEKELTFNATLRDYQERAVQEVIKRRYGILEAATGAGKTIMAIATIPKRNTRTLIIVHNVELMNQWKDQIKKFLGFDCGLVGNGKYEIKDITIGIINSVHKKVQDFQNHFGYVIYDECHRTMGSTWLDVINSIVPKFHLGVTATPFRNDETTKALFAVIGPKLHVVDRGELEETGAIAIPRIIRPASSFYVYEEEKFEYHEIIERLTFDAKRNTMIADMVNEDYKKYKEPVLVVTDRKEHCTLLFNLIDAFPGLKPIILHGSIKKSERKKKVDDFRAGKYNVLIATTTLIGEGFDSPSLGCLFLTTPVKYVGRLLQIVGRILRPSGEEKPRVYDIRDGLVNMLRYSGFARDRSYKKYNWE